MKPTVATAAALGEGRLPELLGLAFTTLEHGRVIGELTLRKALLAPNGFLHAAAVIGLADTACGYGTLASLPEGAQSFTTIELKSNFFATANRGTIRALATLTHGGRSTQVWDAEVRHVDDDRRIALFRCTQMILYPR